MNHVERCFNFFFSGLKLKFILMYCVKYTPILEKLRIYLNFNFNSLLKVSNLCFTLNFEIFKKCKTTWITYCKRSVIVWIKYTIWLGRDKNRYEHWTFSILTPANKITDLCTYYGGESNGNGKDSEKQLLSDNDVEEKRTP